MKCPVCGMEMLQMRREKQRAVWVCRNRQCLLRGKEQK